MLKAVHLPCHTRAVGGLLSPKEQDRFLPIANVGHIMQKALPASAKISTGAKDTVQECISEFISFITEEASDKCQREKRETINSDDLLWAMTTLGFDEYVEPLKVYLQRFHELEVKKGGGGPSASSSTPHHPVESVAASMGIETNMPRYAAGAPAMYGGRMNDDDAGAADVCPAVLILPVSASPDDHAGKEQHVERWWGGSFYGAGLNSSSSKSGYK